MTETREPYNGEAAAQRGADTIETADDGEADAYRQCKVALARMPLGIN